MQRWGTYSSVVADPASQDGFWISNEYVTNGWWQTAVAQVSVHPDTTPPVAPTGLSLDATTDSGTIGDRTTNFAHVKIDGTAERGSAVTLYDSNGTTVLGTGTADLTTGAFSITTSALAEGTHNITAKATDAWGNTSTASAVLAVTEDTTAPTGGTPDLIAASDTGSSSTDNITNDTSPTFQVALNPTVQAGDTIELKFGGASLTHPVLHTITAGDVAAGSVQLTVTAGDLGADGTKSITAFFDDAAGNSSTTAALMITLDTTIATPTVALTDDTGISNTDHVTRDDALTISAAAGDVTRSYSVDGGPASANYVAPMIDGSHTVVVTDTDTAGNTASASITFTLDHADFNFGTSGGMSNSAAPERYQPWHCGLGNEWNNGGGEFPDRDRAVRVRTRCHGRLQR